MERIKEETEQKPIEMIDHIREEIYRGTRTRRALVRNRELEADAKSTPGAELYLPDLEELKKRIDTIDSIIKAEKKEESKS